MIQSDFEHAVEGPIMSMPIMSQIDESVYRLRELFPMDFELRLYVTNDLFKYMAQSVTFAVVGPERPTLWGLPVYRTDGEGSRWWIGVPGFVIPEMKEDT